jgi:hypothetical protein
MSSRVTVKAYKFTRGRQCQLEPTFVQYIVHGARMIVAPTLTLLVNFRKIWMFQLEHKSRNSDEGLIMAAYVF